MFNVHSLTPVFDDLAIFEDDADLETLASFEADVYDADPCGGSASRY